MGSNGLLGQENVGHCSAWGDLIPNFRFAPQANLLPDANLVRF